MSDTATDTAERPARALTTGLRIPERIELGDDGYHLRRLTLDDAEGLHEAIVASFAELHPWMPWCTEPVELSEQREHIERGVLKWESAEALNFGLFRADSDSDAVGRRRLLGSISLIDRIGPGALEIGYWLRTDATGRGLISRAAQALTELGLSLPGIERIEIHCDAANVRSAAVPRRLGYRLDREQAAEMVTPGDSGLDQFWITP